MRPEFFAVTRRCRRDNLFVFFFFFLLMDEILPCLEFVILGRILFCCFFSVNVGCGPAEERVLLTGLHAVADIYCECCKTTLGWKYVGF